MNRIAAIIVSITLVLTACSADSVQREFRGGIPPMVGVVGSSIR